MQVIVCDRTHREVWDRFVDDHAECWHYQRFGWKDIIERSYGHSCPYLLAQEGETVAGVLPVAAVKSRIFGRSLTSLPFLDTGGVAAASDAAREALVNRALELCRERGLEYLELRQTEAVPGRFRIDSHKMSLTMPLQPTVEEQWDAVPSERRNRVRKARKAGLSAQIGGAERLAEFYDVWSRNMRDLGSPAHSVKWFECVFDVFPESVKLLLIRAGGQAVGACVMVDYKGMLAVPWVSSLRSHFAHHPNDLMYWECIKAAVERGCKRFDFGRSTDKSGNFTYKVRWGAEAAPLYWQYRSLGEREPVLPSEDSGKYGLAVGLWKRLPVGVANWLGPRVRRGITS